MEASPAAFKLLSFRFTQASMDFTIPSAATLGISLNPSGTYDSSTGVYHLTFVAIVRCEENGKDVINVLCEADFQMSKPLDFADIPDFFYPNSLAIIFPYIRAFVSTLSLQANVKPIVLPTINISGITEELKTHTSIKQ